MPAQGIAVTTDCVIFVRQQGIRKLLLVKRKKDPFKNHWALPGGFLEKDEPLEVGAARELREETGLDLKHLRQLRAFGTPGRDPRGRTISIAFVGEVDEEKPVEGKDDASQAKWWAVEDLPDLAFDHSEIITFALEEEARRPT